MNFEPADTKYEAVNWFAQSVDGNDTDALVEDFDKARNHPGNQPRIIICDTKMGRGVPFLEARERNHFLRVEADEWEKAIAIIDAEPRQ